MTTFFLDCTILDSCLLLVLTAKHKLDPCNYKQSVKLYLNPEEALDLLIGWLTPDNKLSYTSFHYPVPSMTVRDIWEKDLGWMSLLMLMVTAHDIFYIML
jgi:hypothetical protein